MTMKILNFGKTMVMAPCCDIVEVDWVLLISPENKVVLKLGTKGLGIDWSSESARAQANWVKAQLFSSVPFMAQIPGKYREVLTVTQTVEGEVKEYFTIAEGQFDPEAHKFHFKLSGRSASILAGGILLGALITLGVAIATNK